MSLHEEERKKKKKERKKKVGTRIRRGHSAFRRIKNIGTTFRQSKKFPLKQNR